MESFIWLFVLATLITLATRWLLLRGVSPLSQQAVRQMFVDRLLSSADHCQLLEQTGESLTVFCNGRTCEIFFETLYQRCLEAPTYTILFVREAVQAVVAALTEQPRMPEDWQRQVLPLLVSDDVPAPDGLLLRRLTWRLHVGYVLDGGEAFRWLTSQDAQDAQIDPDALHDHALRNLERSCSTLVIETPAPLPDGRDRLLRFHTQDGLDAARALLPSFYHRFAPRFGDVDVLVAIPTRDTLIAIPATDPAQASFLAWRAEAERRQHAYPLSAQLLRITEQSTEEWVAGAEPEPEG